MNQIEILELKSTMWLWKIHYRDSIADFEQEEETISECEESTIKIIQSDEQKERRKNEQR